MILIILLMINVKFKHFTILVIPEASILVSTMWYHPDVRKGIGVSFESGAVISDHVC